MGYLRNLHIKLGDFSNSTNGSMFTNLNLLVYDCVPTKMFSEGERQIVAIIDAVYHYGFPFFSAIGIIGNALTAFLLSRAVMRTHSSQIMQVSNRYLIGLAFSDLFFNLFVFPVGFNHGRLCSKSSFRGLYSMYGAAFINTFVFSSTWIRVCVALERSFAIMFPVKAKVLVARGYNRAVATVVVLFGISLILNIPWLWGYKLKQSFCHGGNETLLFPLAKPNTTAADEDVCGYYAVAHAQLWGGDFDFHYRLAWAVLGNWVPLILLSIAAVTLFTKIHKLTRPDRSDQIIVHTRRRHLAIRIELSKSTPEEVTGSASASASQNLLSVPETDAERNMRIHRALGQREKRRMNHVVIALTFLVVVEFLVLVAPSETAKQIVRVINSYNEGRDQFAYVAVEAIFNATQLLSFSLNFFIYWYLYPKFRNIFVQAVTCQLQRFIPLYLTASPSASFIHDAGNESLVHGSKTPSRMLSLPYRSVSTLLSPTPVNSTAGHTPYSSHQSLNAITYHSPELGRRCMSTSYGNRPMCSSGGGPTAPTKPRRHLNGEENAAARKRNSLDNTLVDHSHNNHVITVIPEIEVEQSSASHSKFSSKHENF